MDVADKSENPLDHLDLFGGLAGITLDLESFDFDCGITIRRTYAHLMMPMLMAFSPAKPGQPHPAPWKTAHGSAGFNVQVDIHVPVSLKLSGWFDHLNTIWWLTSLIHIHGGSAFRVAVVSDRAFAGIASMEGEPNLWPIESEKIQIQRVREPATSIGLQTLNWVREHWYAGGLLMCKSK